MRVLHHRLRLRGCRRRLRLRLRCLLHVAVRHLVLGDAPLLGVVELLLLLLGLLLLLDLLLLSLGLGLLLGLDLGYLGGKSGGGVFIGDT